MRYGYARVSTFSQAKNGNSLQEQERMLMDTGVPLRTYSLTATREPSWTGRDSMRC